MLVRGASGTPEGTPATSTPPIGRKRKHAAFEDDGAQPLNDSDSIANAVQIARDDRKYRDRLTVSRHPIFAPTGDVYSIYSIDVSALNRQLDKIGFKYCPAGLSAEGAAVPYRTIESAPPCTRVSWEDRNTSIRVTQDGQKLSTDKGFCSARANVGVQEGKWYMEVKIERGGGEKESSMDRMDGAHVRLGWGRREAPLNGPIGLDGYSYGLRDKTGEKVTLSRPRPYGKPFKSGDTIGLYISLPPRRRPNPKDPADPAHTHRERIPIDYKGQEYFESLDYPQSREMIALMDQTLKSVKPEVQHQPKKSATVKNLPTDRTRNKIVPKPQAHLRELPVLRGSKIAFFINGECQGVAFQDIYDFLQLKPMNKKGKEKAKRNKDGPREHMDNYFDDGTLGYYPFFSLYGGARIHLNAGPDFKYPPPLDIDALLSSASNSSRKRTWRPMSERYPEFMAQQWHLDEKEEAALKVQIEKTTQVVTLQNVTPRDVTPRDVTPRDVTPHQKVDKEPPKVSKEVKPETLKLSKEVTVDKPQPEDGVSEPPLDPREAKKAIRREKKRIAEQQRRLRKKEEKLAAAAAAAAAGEQSMDISLTLPPQPQGPSFIPYVPPGMRLDERGHLAPKLDALYHPVPSLVKEEYHEYPEEYVGRGSMDVNYGVSAPQTPYSSEYGGGHRDWQSEGQSDDEGMHDADVDDADHMLQDDTAPSGENFRFQESSARWGHGN